MGFMDKMKKAAESAQAQTSKVGIGADAGQKLSASSMRSIRLTGKPISLCQMSAASSSSR